ncbi:unnamed protein product [Leptosia nina]|uniref:Uncharacterized protein n=1 Tax=Leptosia nina TaxID=320188 RepID=A0AAV1J041_9NEOP
MWYSLLKLLTAGDAKSSDRNPGISETYTDLRVKILRGRRFRIRPRSHANAECASRADLSINKAQPAVPFAARAAFEAPPPSLNKHACAETQLNANICLPPCSP